MSDRSTDHTALTARLAALHVATTSSATIPGSDPQLEDARLIREYAGSDVIELPAPALSFDLAEALTMRRTMRQLSGAPLSPQSLSTLLAYSAGTPHGTALPSIAGGPPGRRTYPSAGALYAVEMLVCTIHVEGLDAGCYRYQTLAHRLVALRHLQGRPALDRMLDGNQVGGAAVALLLWVDFTRPSLGKYGELSYRMALLEAGHLAQNLLLVATAIGIGTAPLCGFDDAMLSREAGLQFPEQSIVYAVAAGMAIADADV